MLRSIDPRIFMLLLLTIGSACFAQQPQVIQDHGNSDLYIIGPGENVPSLRRVAQLEPEQYMLGVALKAVPDGLHGLIGIAPATGVLIAHVTPDGPAEKAGLQKNDLILQVDGETLKSAEQLQKIVKESKDKTLKLSIRRGQEELKVEVNPVQAKDLNWEGQPPWEAQLPQGFEFKIPQGAGNLAHGFEFLGPGIMQMKVPDQSKFNDLEAQVGDLAKTLEQVQRRLEQLEKRINQ